MHCSSFGDNKYISSSALYCVSLKLLNYSSFLQLFQHYFAIFWNVSQKRHVNITHMRARAHTHTHEHFLQLIILLKEYFFLIYFIQYKMNLLLYVRNTSFSHQFFGIYERVHNSLLVYVYCGHLVQQQTWKPRVY